MPVISLEGYEDDTDERRGKGVYERLQRVIEKIKGKGIFWATSLTVTSSNFATVTDEQFIENLVNLGCKLFFSLVPFYSQSASSMSQVFLKFQGNGKRYLNKYV